MCVPGSTTRNLARPAARVTLLVVGLMIASLAVALARGADETASKTRVLVVGDSVTQGWSGSCTWRYFFWQRLQRRGVDDIDMVGPRTGVYESYDWDHQDAYADGDFDQDHAARSGARLGTNGGPPAETIDGLVGRFDPDVVIALWGINDLTHGGADAIELLRSYDEWITRARSVSPDVDLIIGQLPQTWIPGVDDVNAGLVELANERTNADSRVIVAGPSQPFSVDEFKDGIHPHTVGDRRLGTMFESAWWALQGEDPPPLEVPAGDSSDPCPIAGP